MIPDIPPIAGVPPELVRVINDRLRMLDQAAAATTSTSSGAQILQGTLTARTALQKADAGTLYFTTDTYQVFWWGGTSWTEITPGKALAWHTASLQNSWVAAAGYLTPGYRLDTWDGPTVRLRGTTSGGTTANATLIFTLASGYRPTAKAAYAIADRSNNKTALIEIDSAGAVKLYGATASAFLSLDGVTIPLT